MKDGLKSESRFEKSWIRIESNNQKIGHQFRWLMGAIFVSIGGILTTIIVKSIIYQRNKKNDVGCAYVLICLSRNKTWS